jgi:hypothetical protein
MGIEKMKNRFVRYVLIWLLCGLCHTAAFAYSSDPDAQQSKSWGYQPVYSSSTTQPTYRFRSTSVYLHDTDKPEADAGRLPISGRPRRAGEWNEEGNPIGEVDDEEDPMPIGDTPWLFLLLLSAGYLIYRKVQRREA